MWTKKKLLYTLLIAVAGFTACKKEEISSSPAPVTETSRQLAKLTYSNSPNAPVALKYDEKGRLVEAGNQYWSQKYFYNGKSFSSLFTDQNNYVSRELKNGKLDDAGRVTEVEMILHQPNQPDAQYKDLFTYNADGYISKYVHTNVATNSTSQDDYIYSNGNLMTDINTENGQPNIRIEYSYYDDKPNKLAIDFQDGIVNYFTDGLTGKRSRSLKKSIQHYNTQNVKYADVVLVYDLDQQGYPLTYKMTSVITNNVLEQYFEYNK